MNLPYTAEEDAIILRLYPKGGMRPCRKVLNRSGQSIRCRAHKLGLANPRLSGRATEEPENYPAYMRAQTRAFAEAMKEALDACNPL